MIKRKLWILSLILLLAVLAGPASAELNDMEQLGKNIFFDNISNPEGMSCAECHGRNVGFTGPNASINLKGSVYEGAVPGRFANRKPPSSAYATLSPILHTESENGSVEFVGGNFWDGRATGKLLCNPAADQAMGPFLNPLEQNNPSKKAVLIQIAASNYTGLWEDVWGEPISYSNKEEIDMNYNRTALSIAVYENSSEVNQFSSKYDAYLDGKAKLTDEEALGLALFNAPNNNDGIKKKGEGGNCMSCHSSEGNSPLFTEFDYENIGVPRNPDNPFYKMNKVYLDDGTPINPEGKKWIDPGLGGFLNTSSVPGWKALAYENMGKQKVPTLRNVALKPESSFPKAYMHNGYFKDLKSVVHFLNTRDVLEKCPDNFTREKDALKMNCWPNPEVPENVDTEIGNMGLNESEEKAIVAFLETLSDGYRS